MCPCFVFLFGRLFDYPYPLPFLQSGHIEWVRICVFLLFAAPGVCVFYIFILFLPWASWVTSLYDLQFLSLFVSAPYWNIIIVVLFTMFLLIIATRGFLFLVFFTCIYLIVIFFNRDWYYFTGLFSQTINPLLSNPLNYTHPLLTLSCSVIFSFIAIFLPLTILNYKIFRYIFCFLTLVCLFFIFSTLLTLLALLFGVFWALQLDSWGGWWAWDASEVLLLQLGILLVLLVHSPHYGYCFSIPVVLISLYCYYLISWFFIFVYSTHTLHTFTSLLSIFPQHYFSFVFLSFISFIYYFSWIWVGVRQFCRLLSLNQHLRIVFTIFVVFMVSLLCLPLTQLLFILLIYLVTIFISLGFFRINLVLVLHAALLSLLISLFTTTEAVLCTLFSNSYLTFTLVSSKLLNELGFFRFLVDYILFIEDWLSVVYSGSEFRYSGLFLRCGFW